MSDPITGELRWFIGKVTHCAANAKDLAEFSEWLENVEIPPAADGAVDSSHDHAHRAIHAAYEAISLLYMNDKRQEAIAQIRLGNAIEDLSSRASLARPPEVIAADGGVVDEVTAEAAVVASQPESRAELAGESVTLEQSVSAGRDINAPIINATGDVAINDRSGELHDKLHDYLTYIIFISLGIKQSHVTGEAASLVDDALTALTDYHKKTYSTVDGAFWGNYRELRSHALPTWEAVDAACKAVLGLSLDEARLGLFESPFPDFDLFSDMVLVRGGFDPYTGRNVDPYYISRTPVTMAQYDEFCRTLHYPRVPEWEGMSPPTHMGNHPVTGVALFDTVMFCVWLETATGFRFRLPTESEWCFAATEGRRQAYPWGNEYRPGLATTSLESPTGTTPVDARPSGASASGVLDLVGNVWELVATLYADDASAPDMDVSFPPMMFALAREAWWSTDRRIPHGAGPWFEAARLVMRGGSWGGGPEWATMDRRIWTSMFNRGAYGGFRVVCSAQRIDNGYLPTPSYLSPRVAGFADRIQLTNSDGTSALTQKDFSGCGGGGTAEGSVWAELRDTALSRYQGVGEHPFDDGILIDRAAEVANPSSFPPLRPHGTFKLPEAIAEAAGPTYGETNVERLVYSRLEDETRSLLTAARTEAVLRGHDRLTSGHVLLAIAMRPSRSASVLATFGLDADVISNLLLDAPADEGPNSPGNESFTDALVRLLLPRTEGHGRWGHEGLKIEDLLRRIASEPTAIARAIFAGVGVTGEEIIDRLRLLGRISVVRYREWGDDLTDLDAALDLLDILPSADVELFGARAVLCSAKANLLAKSDADPQQVERADVLARSERAALGDAIQDVRGGLIKELWIASRRMRLESDDNVASAISILGEIIQMESGHDRHDSHLVISFIDRGILLLRSHALDKALNDFDRAIHLVRVSRRRALSHAHLLALALNNRAHVLGELGSHGEALEAITESLQVLFPHLVAQELSWADQKATVRSPQMLQMRPELNGAAPSRLDLAPFESTLRITCQALTQEPDARFLAYFDYFRLVAVDTERLLTLPVLDPPPLRLAAGEPDTCDFCSQEPAAVRGVYASIGPTCLELALEVLVAESEASTSGLGRCDLCGRMESHVGPVVYSGMSRICRSCVDRSAELQSSR